jgi:hypothetical protein
VATLPALFKETQKISAMKASVDSVLIYGIGASSGGEFVSFVASCGGIFRFLCHDQQRE